MAQKIRDIMSTDLVSIDASSRPQEAARCMRDHDIGCVIVERDDQLLGIVTDRDLVVRGLAEDDLDRDIGSFCSKQVATLSPDADIDDAVQMMEENAVRRIPVVENGRPVGIVSIGDLAAERDPASALGQISAAPPNR